MPNNMLLDQYAVFGDPIKHSKSPRIHQLFAKQTGQSLEYHARQVPALNFEQAVQHFFAQNGKGINCTVPLKELAWQLADELTPRAQSAKAVNTLKLTEDGRLLGDNTDGVGLIQDLTVNHSLTLRDKSILILGAGGATRGIISPLLAERPNQLVIANRTIEKAVNLVTEFNHPMLIASHLVDLNSYTFDLVINATSASLTGELPDLPANLLNASSICYDLAYANTPTPFVLWGKLHNATKSLDGLGMLVEQAAAAFLLWRGVYPDTATVIALLNNERSEI